jgi:MYXO-CTERM domain-containing protein
MSITTDGGTSDEELCQLIEALSAYAEQYEPGTIEGVESLNIQSSTASVDGISCIQPEVDETPPIVAKGIGAEEDDSSKDKELLPLLSLGLLLVAAALFVRRRRKIRSEDEEEERKRLQELSAQDIGNDEQLAFGAGYRNGALNAVNVHKCTSAQCTICNDNRKGTEFLPLENVDKWVNQQNTKIEGKSPGMPLETLPQEEHKDDLDGVEQETQEEERSRLIADAKRVLGEESASLDMVEADRLDDRLRGLPTLPEGPEDSDSSMPDTRREKDTGSI